MNDKVNISLIVPEINERYNVIVPINKKIGTVVKMLNKGINEYTNGLFPVSEYSVLCDANTMQLYPYDLVLYSTNIRNGSKVILLTK